MDTLSTNLHDTLRVDFSLARLELAEARSSQQRKDTPAARAQVEACRARLDRILDTWLEARLLVRPSAG